MSRTGTSLLAAALVAAALIAPGSAQRTAVAPCSGSSLEGTFALVPGSAGAGHVVYRLRLTNRAGRPCFVTGVPPLTLLGADGTALPTQARFGGRPGTLTAIVVPLAPGGAAALTARFSPDVPGPGEPAAGRCERTASRLRVRPSGGGSVTVPIRPATPVCEHGAMSLTVFTSA